MTAWERLRTPQASPPVAPLRRSVDGLLGLCLAAFGFFLPFSTAGVSVMALVLLALAISFAPAIWRCAPWREPVIATGLVLLGYIVLHTLWRTGLDPQSWKAINRYQELFLAALLLALFRLQSRKDLFLWGLACGAVAYGLAHWVGLFSPRLAALMEFRRISAGYGLALCSFVLLEQARHMARPWAIRAVAAFLAITVLFAIEGRTGHMVLILLVAIAAWLHAPRKWRWSAFVIAPVLVFAMALVSTAVQKRMGETLAGSAPTQAGQMSSTGIRIELLRNGLALAREHFITGAGYARYAEVHESSIRAQYGSDPARQEYLKGIWVKSSNPHNEYLMQLVGGGVVALALFLVWLSLPVLRRTPSAPLRASLVGVSLAFALGCLFNSMLMDFVEGHLTLALMAWLLAQDPEGAPAARGGTG